MSRTIFSTLLLGCLLGWAGCSSPPPTVDDALLSHVASEHLGPVAEARTAKGGTEVKLARGNRDERAANDAVSLARSELRTTRNGLDDAKLAIVLAEKNGTSADVEAAKTRFAKSNAVADAAREKLSLEKRRLELAELRTLLATEAHRLATAEFELAKATAVLTTDIVEARKTPIVDFEKQVLYHKSEVVVAQKRVSSAEQRVDEAQSEYDKAQGYAESLSAR